LIGEAKRNQKKIPTATKVSRHSALKRRKGSRTRRKMLRREKREAKKLAQECRARVSQHQKHEENRKKSGTKPQRGVPSRHQRRRGKGPYRRLHLGNQQGKRRSKKRVFNADSLTGREGWKSVTDYSKSSVGRKTKNPPRPVQNKKKKKQIAEMLQ